MATVMASLGVLLLCLVTLSLSAEEYNDNTYENPVVLGDHPDPGLSPSPINGLFYVATTSGDCTDCFPIMRSKRRKNT